MIFQWYNATFLQQNKKGSRSTPAAQILCPALLNTAGLQGHVTICPPVPLRCMNLGKP